MMPYIRLWGPKLLLRTPKKALLRWHHWHICVEEPWTMPLLLLDEAQNTTPAQMKMFLTRIGFGSKVVITGDQTQKDLPKGTKSGLDVAIKVLSKIDDIGFSYLTNQDVVRHPLVQKIVKAYDAYEEKQKRYELMAQEQQRLSKIKRGIKAEKSGVIVMRTDSKLV